MENNVVVEDVGKDVGVHVVAVVHARMARARRVYKFQNKVDTLKYI